MYPTRIWINYFRQSQDIQTKLKETYENVMVPSAVNKSPRIRSTIFESTPGIAILDGPAA